MGLYSVVVKGMHFPNVANFMCRFGSQVSRATWNSQTEIECIAPPVTHAGTVSLSVSVNGFEFVDVDRGFTYTLVPSIQKLIPDRGVSLGGTRVHVIGSGFQPQMGLYCQFGHTPTLATYLNHSALMCNAPAMLNSSMVQVFISANGKTIPNQFSNYTYFSTPRILSVEPKILHVSQKTVFVCFEAVF